MNAELKVATTSPPITQLTPGRRALLLTLLAFLLPLTIGGGLYWSGWRPTKTGNHGELILPPKPVPVATLGEGAAGKWLLVLAGDGACESDCITQLKTMRSIQVSLGREIERMRRVVLTGVEIGNDASNEADKKMGYKNDALKVLQSEQPDLIVRKPSAEWRSVLAAGPRYRVFLVDPAGNLMMQYAPEAEPKGIRADLERLLKYSWIG